MCAVGDLRANSVKRIASAVGEGSVVISDVHRYLADHRDSVAARPEVRLNVTQMGERVERSGFWEGLRCLPVTLMYAQGVAQVA
jgi:hypothetical protein